MRLFSLTFFLAVFSSLLFAQNETRVCFTGPENSISCTSSFENGATSEVVAVSNGSNFKDLIVRADGASTQIIVADAASSAGVYRFPNIPSSGSPPTDVVEQIALVSDANGLAMCPNGDIFVTNEAGGTDTVWFIEKNKGAPGWNSKTKIDDVSGVSRLHDVLCVPFNKDDLSVGDLLVVASPGAVLHYQEPAGGWGSCSGACSPTTFQSNFGGEEPSGVALDPTTGNLLVVAGNRVMRFPPTVNGNPLSDFAALPATGVKMATGFVDGAPKAWVTIHQGGLVQQYGFDGNGIGVFDGEVAGINPPHGVADATSGAGGFVTAGAGSVTRVPGDEITFSNIAAGGVLTSQLVKFYDPRNCGMRGNPCPSALELDSTSITDVRDADNQPVDLHPDLDLKLPPEITDSGVEIAAHMRGFEDSDGEFFIVSIQDTTATFQGIIADHFEQEDVGLSITCEPDGTFESITVEHFEEPRVLQSRKTGEAQFLNHPFPFDVTTGCQSCCRAHSWRKSLFFWGTNTQDWLVRIQDALPTLKDQFTMGSSCLKRNGRRAIGRAIDSASRRVNQGRCGQAEGLLQNLLSTIAAADFSSCDPEYAASLEAITLNVLWDIRKLDDDCSLPTFP